VSRFDRLYAALPTPAQHAAVTAYGAYWYWQRFGPGYRDALRGYLAREWWPAAGWDTWQRDRLTVVLRRAAEHVPHYRAAWTASEHASARAGELAGLPLLEKDPIRDAPEAFVDEALRPRRPLVFHTSGSTGTPIATYWTRRELRDTLAVREARSARWAGVSFRLPRATFSGRLVEPDSESRGPFHRYNLVERQVYLSAFHLAPDTAAAYVDGLRRHKTQWATGYAVSFYLLARYILEHNVATPQLQAVITTSEKLTDEMRETIAEAFRCRVWEEYSTVENAVFASECEEGSLHVSPDVARVEILRSDGTPAAPSEVGEVVVTTLSRQLQPLIRFRLGDLASWSGDPCGCGRALPVIQEVVGRLEDVVTGPDGRQLVRFHGIFVDQPNVREGQVVQETTERFRVRVVPTEAFSPTDEADIVARMHQRLGSGATVVVERVEKIERTAAGKFPAVVSLIDK
jgi:phenylacetate-CoA ligase